MVSSILVINPNSSQSVTERIKEVVDPAPDFNYKFFTPHSGPKQIDSYTTEITSANACLVELEPILHQHDAFLVACYSDHPLVHILREHTDKPVLGIFQASILHAMALGTGKYAIVTTARIWESLLDDAVSAFTGSHHNYVGTFSTGLGVLDLHDLSPDLANQHIARAANAATEKGAKYILLGCAGMAGMEKAVIEAVGDSVTVIDGVVAGTEILAGLVRAQTM